MLWLQSVVAMPRKLMWAIGNFGSVRGVDPFFVWLNSLTLSNRERRETWTQSIPELTSHSTTTRQVINTPSLDCIELTRQGQTLPNRENQLHHHN